MTREGEDSVTTKGKRLGIYTHSVPNVGTRLPGQGDHVQGSHDLRSHDLCDTRSRDFRARRANRRDGLTGSLSSISSQQEGWLDGLAFEHFEPTGGMAR